MEQRHDIKGKDLKWMVVVVAMLTISSLTAVGY